MYGRSEDEWYDLLVSGYDQLKRVARLGRTISYTDLNSALQRDGLRGFDFTQAKERAAMGHLLGLIVEHDQKIHPGLMLSAIVLYHNANDAGSGFYNLAKQKNLIRSGESKDEFWLRQLKTVYETFQK